MSATVIAIVHLTSFGFLHPGRERFKRVTKEAWPFIPGSTLYGAVAAALIRLDCQEEKPVWKPAPAAKPMEGPVAATWPC